MNLAEPTVTPIVAADSPPQQASASVRATAHGRGRRIGRSVLRALWLLVAIAAGLVLLGASVAPQRSPLEETLDRLTAGMRFDLVNWEIDALTAKANALVNNPAADLPSDAASALVREHLRLAERAGQLEGEIERIYADPREADPQAASEALRAELETLRSQLDAQAGAVEAILEGQFSQIIAMQGLESASVTWPPPRLSFTRPPELLIVSPREEIKRLRSVDLVADLNSADRERLEGEVMEEEGLSAYVTRIGGYGVYPTMVVDRHGLPWTAETIAHEWIHNYLAFRPLGWAFLEGGETVTINETVASIAGDELGRALLQAYYPDLLPPPVEDPPAGAEAEPDDPDRFDFGAEMRANRVAVDELLAAGFVEEAEAFMEARRKTFVDNGYRLRVLNQAYFAFHGSYATGAASSDPIGPKLEQLRELTPDLRTFLRLTGKLTSRQALDDLLAQLEANSG